MKSSRRREQTDSKQDQALFIGIALSFLFSVTVAIFSALCLKYYKQGIIGRYSGVFIGVAVGICTVYFAVSVFALYRRKQALFRLLISGYLFLIFVLVLWFILQRTGFFKVFGDQDAYLAYLEKTGALMPLVYILFQYLQVVVLPIPGFVSTAAGVALFGPTMALLYSLVGVIGGSLTAFFIGRKFGYKAVAWMIGEDDLKKWLKKVKGKDNFILTAMFLLPLFPDDVLCFIAGLSSMSWKYFIVMIIITRVLAISATCYSVNFIPVDTWWGISLWILMFLAVVLLFIILYKNMDAVNARFKKIFKSKRKRAPREQRTIREENAHSKDENN